MDVKLFQAFVFLAAAVALLGCLGGQPQQAANVTAPAPAGVTPAAPQQPSYEPPANYSAPASTPAPLENATPQAPSQQANASSEPQQGAVIIPGVSAVNGSSAAAPQAPAPSSALKPLGVQILTPQSAHPGDNITVLVLLKSGDFSVSGADVHLTLTDASGNSQYIEGVTNATGEYAYSWTLGAYARSGDYIVGARAVKSGYLQAYGSVKFRII